MTSGKIDDLPTGSETVLLVEDDVALRKVMVRVLPRLGYTVIEAKHGAAALEVLAHTDIDLLLTDVVMPGDISGPDLARLALKQNGAIKVVLATGYADDLISEIADLRHHAVLLRKPFRREELARVLRQALDG
ncbi:MAG: response regulator [Alphaproteobacteria bacterium]|nr:response regulator [Alphaproteobacteria bacterium]